MFKISIKEDGELKDILQCKEGTVKNWLREKIQEKGEAYVLELFCLLLKELRNKKEE